MKQEKYEIRCSEIEKRLGKCCFFEKSYKNTRTKKQIPPSVVSVFASVGLEPISMQNAGGILRQRHTVWKLIQRKNFLC